MRGLAIGSALALILVLVSATHFLLVLLIPLALFALLRYRTTWQPATTYRPRTRRRGPADPEDPDRDRLELSKLG